MRGGRGREREGGGESERGRYGIYMYIVSIRENSVCVFIS